MKTSKSTTSSFMKFNDTTMLDSIAQDSYRINQSIVYDDSIGNILIVQNAMEHIRIIRDHIATSRSQLKQIRQHISELRAELSTLEHQQRKQLINMEYEISTAVQNLKQYFEQAANIQQGEYLILDKQIQAITIDHDNIQSGIDDVDMQIRQLCGGMGQYTYTDYQDI